jgi:hypothetical protein
VLMCAREVSAAVDFVTSAGAPVGFFRATLWFPGQLDDLPTSRKRL